MFIIEQELKYYELLLKLSGTPIPPRKELLKLCYGSEEFFLSIINNNQNQRPIFISWTII